MSPVHIGKETVRSADLDHGHLVVGVAAAQLFSRDLRVKYGVLLYAAPENSANIWIGKSGVTADNNAVTGGFPLIPGSSIILPIEDMVNIYGISTAATQDLTWLGV